jgi:hypothetical protein
MGVLHGTEIVELADRHGKLERGLRALGIDSLNYPDAVKWAKRNLSLTHESDHFTTYGLLGAFVGAAFPGALHRYFVHATVSRLRAEAPRSKVVDGPHDVERFVSTARQFGIPLEGVELLSTERRPQRRDRAAGRRILRLDEVFGSNILGPEDGASDTLSTTLDDLQAMRRGRGATLLIHAGERDLPPVGSSEPTGGARTVNQALDELAHRSRSEDLSGIHVIIGHASRIHDLDRARVALERLWQRGVRVSINPQPIANLVYDTVQNLGQIDAFRTGWWDIVAGTDNAGTLAENRAIDEAMLRGQRPGAERIARAALRRYTSPLDQAGRELRKARIDVNGKPYAPRGAVAPAAP